jgi:competence protein ComEC
MFIQKNKYKILLLSGIVVVLLAVPAFWFVYRADSNLEVDFLNVGQGDAELIKTPFGQNILIDGGPDSSVLGVLGDQLAFWDRKIDLMILSHPHEDHITGLVEVLKRYDVKKIIYTGVAYNAPVYPAWQKLVADKKIPVSLIIHPQIIELSENCHLQILFPQENLVGKGFADLNDTSIVARLTYGQTNFLFTGDAGKAIEAKLPKSEISAQVLKVGHHGSDNSTAKEFIESVKPELAVIEAGAGNKYGLPSERTINLLKRENVKVFRTDLDGTVRVLSDGLRISTFTAF